MFFRHFISMIYPLPDLWNTLAGLYHLSGPMCWWGICGIYEVQIGGVFEPVHTDIGPDEDFIQHIYC